MDLNYSPDELAFRDEVRGWLRTNLPADLREKMESYQELSKDELLRWHKILARKGWVAPDWPQEWGGTDWNVVQRYIFEEECGYAAAPADRALRRAHVRAGAAALRHRGAEEAVPARASTSGEDFWCQGYSEPGSGSRPGVAQDARGAARAITTWSPARRSGPRWRTTRTGSSASCAPIPTPTSARTASRSS